jgi:FRG domain-containing protein
MSLPGKEIRVSSWLELVSELHSKNVVPFCPDEGNHLRSSYVFRGMDVASWGLETSFERLPKTQSTQSRVVERSLLRSFRKYASAGAFDQRSEWYVLAVAQHNGLPTRCLDWTASPLIAAHFACGDERYKNDDAAIWCLHVGILRDINELSNSRVRSLRGVAWVYDTRLLESSFAGLDALDSSAADGELMLLWEPPSLDQRIASQSGMLSIMNSDAGSQNAFLQTHCIQHPDLVLRIIIPAAMKSEARDMLDQNNITERALFPGLPGLCSWLKRYYGTSW